MDKTRYLILTGSSLALLCGQGLASPGSSPRFVEEHVTAAQLLRHEHQSDQRRGRQGDRNGQNSMTLDVDVAQDTLDAIDDLPEKATEDTSLLDLSSDSIGVASGYHHKCTGIKDCIYGTCGIGSEVSCVKGWCFSTRKFKLCDNRAEGYQLDDGGVCRGSDREAVCPPNTDHSCHDLPIPRAARENNFVLKKGDELGDVQDCADVMKETGVSCSSKPLAVTFCRKTCGRCKSCSPWCDHGASRFTRMTTVIPETPVEKSLDVAKSIENEVERIEEETGEDPEIDNKAEAENVETDKTEQGIVWIGMAFGICAICLAIYGYHLMENNRKEEEIQKRRAELEARSAEDDEGDDDPDDAVIDDEPAVQDPEEVEAAQEAEEKRREKMVKIREAAQKADEKEEQPTEAAKKA